MELAFLDAEDDRAIDEQAAQYHLQDTAGAQPYIGVTLILLGVVVLSAVMGLALLNQVRRIGHGA